MLFILLTLCVAFAPLQMTSAGSMDHMQSMSADCSDCGVGGEVDTELCETAECMLQWVHCSASAVFGISQDDPQWSRSKFSAVGAIYILESRYRSLLDFSIYRPPIS